MYIRTISLIMFFLFTSLHADVISGSSSGTGLDIDVTAAGLLTVDIGPFAQSSGSAPSAYDLDNEFLGVDVDVGILVVEVAHVGADTINTTASSTVDGSTGSKNAIGSSTVSGVDVTLIPAVDQIFPLPDFNDLLSITATTIGSTSTSSGDYGSLGSVGTSVLENLDIKVDGVSLVLDADPEPNTSVIVDAGGIAGLDIYLNEQIAIGDGITSSGIRTNALRIELDAITFGLVSALDSNIIIGQSESLIVVPELSTLGLTSVALAAAMGLCFLPKRRRTRKVR
ncbi:hypothetical protein P3T73_05040 [Kiritimatiellota bacterium B12222]|nr:hypothetical protein P3T73_05040 [Kiritimatiellota bacterium B12222]